MLFEPQRHEPLAASTWSASAAEAAIAEICAEAQQAFSPTSLYPAHPMDDLTEGNGGSAHYFGAGGVLWALDYLGRRGYASRDVDWLVSALSPLVERIADETAKFPMRGEVSYLFGDLPVLMHLYILTGATEWQDKLMQRFSQSVGCPVREMMWGTPGVLLASQLLTSQPSPVLKDNPDMASHLQAVDVRNVQSLLSAWNYKAGEHLVWREELYGHYRLFAGPVHGYAGQVQPLLQRIQTLSDEQRTLVLTRSKHYLLSTAAKQDGMANWPAFILDDGQAEPPAMVQYCHGAPGMVISFCHYPTDADVDALLCQGGELIWQAGPLSKGSNICHGTAGNGYAFLSLYQRTGDAIWLDRARAFAMHAIKQYQHTRQQVGFSRFSLWTGDPGLAIYLADCIEGEGKLPTIEAF